MNPKKAGSGQFILETPSLAHVPGPPVEIAPPLELDLTNDIPMVRDARGQLFRLNDGATSLADITDILGVGSVTSTEGGTVIRHGGKRKR